MKNPRMTCMDNMPQWATNTVNMEGSQDLRNKTMETSITMDRHRLMEEVSLNSSKIFNKTLMELDMVICTIKEEYNNKLILMDNKECNKWIRLGMILILKQECNKMIRMPKEECRNKKILIAKQEFKANKTFQITKILFRINMMGMNSA